MAPNVVNVDDQPPGVIGDSLPPGPDTELAVEWSEFGE